ncbi:acyclic terpene utilization AtuA family protein [Roseococcus sp. DSY-14]|uniref:acyclic terpene utilization AtuA family protein n=1 Tax=Roseococcus sp. DSY-14 TaxID=3369650 RepID=UPI00387A89D4
MTRPFRIGAGAGYAGDRIEPAAELAEHGRLDVLAFECLAERTIALAQAERLRDPARGFDPLLEARLEAVLPACRRQGTRIVSNMGAANPRGAARAAAAVARSLGFAGLRVAAVEGDDVLPQLRAHPGLQLLERPADVASLGDSVVSANAYAGVAGILAALGKGADIVLTGRVGDPALFLAPLMHHFGWAPEDWDRLGQGTAIGHLLECAGQVTGGYFADPGAKSVAELARLGFPLAEVQADGTALLTKVPGSGGRVTPATCKEQLLYELLDPAAYLQPDVVADFTAVRLDAAGPDAVRVSGGRGRPRPDTLKVSIGHRDGFIGEGQMSYAGPGCLARGRLALEVVRERLRLTGVRMAEARFELIGVDSVLPGAAPAAEPNEVRLRVAARTDSLAEAVRVGNEVETLYTNGPAGGGGAFKAAREVLAVASTLVPRAWVTPSVHLEVA